MVNCNGTLQALTGFQTSIRPTQAGLHMALDLTNTGFLIPLLVTEFAQNVVGSSSGRDGRGGGRGRGRGRHGDGEIATFNRHSRLVNREIQALR